MISWIRLRCQLAYVLILRIDVAQNFNNSGSCRLAVCVTAHSRPEGRRG